ncbi:splicing factor YJU2-like isoform X2 [Apostichopus japonicus]|uniref:splicing factor YJU2-like isoform X2 n=1 Tax=Stichopus japonicus TaxID=307972 RepID=UPI003AB7863A
MSERKVLNKYYPPDFDPSKIPKLKQQRNKQYTIRTMAPFNMRCNTCADYIYKGRKFNAKCEVAEGENFLGLRIYRFYIRCPKCITEIMFKTDPENTDYTLEVGATRLFEAAKLIEEAEKRDQLQRDEDATNPMKMLETRTKDSKLEMDIMENLEDLREINTRKEEVDYTVILKKKAEEEQERLVRQEQEDEDEIKRIFGRTSEGSLKRIQDDLESDEEESSPPLKKQSKGDTAQSKGKSPATNRQKILSLIKRKQPVDSDSSSLEGDSNSASTSWTEQIPTTSNAVPVHTTKDSGRRQVPPGDMDTPSASATPPASATPQGKLVDSNANGEVEKGDGDEDDDDEDGTENESAKIFDSIKEGLTKSRAKLNKKEEEIKGSSFGFGLLVDYDGSGSSSSDGE